MKRIFMQSLKNEIKEQVKGEIYVRINDGTLIVYIIDGYVDFKITYKNIYRETLFTRLSVKPLAKKIVKSYRNHILDTYFKK